MISEGVHCTRRGDSSNDSSFLIFSFLLLSKSSFFSLRRTRLTSFRSSTRLQLDDAELALASNRNDTYPMFFSVVAIAFLLRYGLAWSFRLNIFQLSVERPNYCCLTCLLGDLRKKIVAAKVKRLELRCFVGVLRSLSTKPQSRRNKVCSRTKGKRIIS